MVFVLDKDVPMNSMDDLLKHTKDNRKKVLKKIKNGEISTATLKGGNAQKYFGKSDVDVSIKEIEVYTVDGSGNVKKNQIGKAGSGLVRGVKKSDFINSVPDFKIDPKLADKAWALFEKKDWKGLENFVNTNKINGGWPPNNGFKNLSHIETGF